MALNSYHTEDILHFFGIDVDLAFAPTLTPLHTLNYTPPLLSLLPLRGDSQSVHIALLTPYHASTRYPLVLYRTGFHPEVCSYVKTLGACLKP